MDGAFKLLDGKKILVDPVSVDMLLPFHFL